jgi:hypothetical protein
MTIWTSFMECLKLHANQGLVAVLVGYRDGRLDLGSEKRVHSGSRHLGLFALTCEMRSRVNWAGVSQSTPCWLGQLIDLDP